MRKSALIAFGLVVAVLVALGLVILASASEANGIRYHKDAYFFVKRQFAYFGIGLVITVCTALFDYHKWRDCPWLAWLAYGAVLLMLLAVFPPLGHAVKGSFRWINLGPVNVQPSEFAKLVVVLILSVWLDQAGWRVELFGRGAFWSFLILGGLIVPVMLEPDFGSTLVMGLVGMLIMFLAGVRILHFVPFVLLGGGVFAVRVLTNANRMARVAAFFKSDQLSVVTSVAGKAAENAAYQGHMALVAFGNGGLTGVGLNQSMQKHYYLPEAHTDMIFAIGAEELGLGFSIGTWILFLLFFCLAVYVACKASDRFGRFLVAGMTFVVFFAAMFNMGVVCEAFPMKGMALPFFSYGGTNMLCACFAVGTIFSVGLHAYRDRKRQLLSKILTKGR